MSPVTIFNLTNAKIIRFQVICKKFQIPCPVEVGLIINETLNSTLTQPTAFTPEMVFNMTDDDSCRPRYFIFNSQVTKCTFSFLKILGKKRGILAPGNLKITPKAKGGGVVATL